MPRHDVRSNAGARRLRRGLNEQAPWLDEDEEKLRRCRPDAGPAEKDEPLQSPDAEPLHKTQPQQQ